MTVFWKGNFVFHRFRENTTYPLLVLKKQCSDPHTALPCNEEIHHYCISSIQARFSQDHASMKYLYHPFTAFGKSCIFSSPCNSIHLLNMNLFHSDLSKWEMVIFKPQMNLVCQILSWWNVWVYDDNVNEWKFMKGSFWNLAAYLEMGRLICTVAGYPAGGHILRCWLGSTSCQPLALLGTVTMGPHTVSDHSAITCSRSGAAQEARPVDQRQAQPALLSRSRA